MAADGSVVIEIRGDDKEFKASLGSLGSVASSALKGVATAVTAATAAVGGLATAAATVGAEFEASLAGTSTMFGDVEVDTEGLTDKILTLSNASGLAASDISNSLYNALSAGIPVTEDMGDAMEYMESCTKLAAAGFTDVDTAVTATAKVMNAYGMSTDEVDKIQRIMLQTQNKGITTVNELGATLAQVTPTAAAMGVSFENVGAALATMTAQGTPTAQATTQLNSLLAELGKSGTTAAMSLEAATEGTEYAGKSFSQLMAEGVPLNEVLDLIAVHADKSGLSMIDMFSSIEAGKAALAMAGDNSAKFASNLEAMGTEADLVGDAYGKVTDTLEHKISVLKEGVKNLGIAVYEDMKEPLKGAADMASGWLAEVTAAFNEGGLAGAVESLGTVFAEALSEITSLAPQIVNAGIKLLGAFVSGILNNVDYIIQAGLDVILALLDGLISGTENLASGALLLVDSLAMWIEEYSDILVEKAAILLTKLITGIAEALPGIALAGIQIVVSLATAIIDSIPILIEAIPQIITSLVEGLLASIPQIISAGIDLLTSLVTALPEIIETIVAAIPLIIEGIVTALLENLPVIVQAGIDLLVALIQALPEIITTIVTALPQIIDSIVTALLDNLPLIIDCGVQLFVALIQNLPTIIVEIVKAVPQIVAGIVEGFVSLAGTIADIGKDIVSGIWDGICGMADWIKEKVTGFFGGIVDGVKDFLGIHSPSKVFADIGNNTVAGYAEGVDSGADSSEKQVLNTVSGLSEAMAGALGGSGGNAGVALMNTLTTAATAALPQVATVAASVVTVICDTITAKLPEVAAVATNIVKTVCDTILSYHSSFYGVGVDAMSGFNEGLREQGKVAIATARSIANAIIAEMQRAMDIHSPSRKMRDLVGIPTAQGFIAGFEDEMDGWGHKMQAAVNAETAKISLNAATTAEGKAASSGVTREVHTTTNKVEKVARLEGDGVTGELIRMLGLRLKDEDTREGGSLED